MKTDLRNTDTKERVIAQALRLYQTGGYNHLNLDTIAKTLNITRPALYFHFPGGKDGLLVEVIKAVRDEMSRQLEDAVCAGNNVQERIKNILISVANNPLLYQRELVEAELAQLTAVAQRELTQLFVLIKQNITGVIQQGIDSGELRPVDPNIAFLSFLGLCKQIAHYQSLRQCVPPEFTADMPTNNETLTVELLDLWFNGVKANI